jgi:hypothetical protein
MKTDCLLSDAEMIKILQQGRGGWVQKLIEFPIIVVNMAMTADPEMVMLSHDLI